MIEKILKLADYIEADRKNFIKLLCKEAGKTIRDADSEIREAIDFCRFYAEESKKIIPVSHKGVSGESNITYYPPRGHWLAICPWNFPLAIFVGQTVAPLVMGNKVTIKASNSTSKISLAIYQLMMSADLDVELTFSRDLNLSTFNGISFTGSHETAKIIHRDLSKLDGEIIPFIAETSGLNCTVVDSSVLLEQTVKLIAESAFNSNGQRCSSTRQLMIQDTIADEFINMLIAHMNTWIIGDTFSADYTGEKYVIRAGTIKEEIFGPNLSYTTFKDKKEALDMINASGYGLTLGIHSRVQGFCDYFSKGAKVGNIYINRNQIGAVVESQPFGGAGLSGTGPSAGGKDYLKTFVYEKTVTTNLTALGGNVELLT
jgi:RHH-type proline utilization regulon transcriptional repressor/proline dehydrogenase/delta 1-pyrroline-5-carboxylate dehydrogenase